MPGSEKPALVSVWRSGLVLITSRNSDMNETIHFLAEDHIRKYVSRHRIVYRFFNVYDLEEQRL